MRSSWFKLYAPFLVLALVQGMFIAVAPSRGGNQAVATFGGGGAFDPNAGQPSSGDFGGQTFDPVSGDPIDSGSDFSTDFDSGFDSTGSTPSGSSFSGSSGSGSSSSPSGSSGTATSPGSSGGQGTTATTVATGGGAPKPAAGDTSHCTPEGLQFGIIRDGGPPCVAKWPAGANNGGQTYQGVTDKEITVVYFSSIPNEQVNAVLAPQGLATSEEENIAAADAYMAFLNKHFETYGRTVKYIRVVGDCPTTPPDYDACIAAAQEVVKLKPFAVIWGTSLYASVFDVWAKNGIIALGGQHFEERFFNQRRPFRYDTFMDGTQSARHIAEYYCKKMAKGTATHAGRLIHPQVGDRTTPRRLGVVVPEIEANVLNAQLVSRLVKECGGGSVPVFTYESDIERATEQTQATVSKMIAEGITTVSCMCDPIAPAFLTKGLAGNRYFPEFLLPGLGLLDFDKLGRLYDPEIMAHAFGPSHLGLNVAADDTDQARAWRDVGNQGHPCGDNGCGVLWTYFVLLGSGVHMAGPNLNPATFETGLLRDLPNKGGTPESPLADYGPNDYTGLGDAKDAYWSAAARSSIDGQAGAYIVVDGGKRVRLGQWTPGLDKIPAAAS